MGARALCLGHPLVLNYLGRVHTVSVAMLAHYLCISCTYLYVSCGERSVEGG